MVAWTKSGEGNISFVANGRQYYVNTEHKAHTKVLEGLKTGASEDDLVGMVERASAVNKYFESEGEGTVSVVGGVVTYKDKDGSVEECHGTLVDRIISFMDEGLPVTPLINFLKKMMQNPSYEASQELYDFLEHKSLPICEDGDFLAYKAVTSDYKDKQTRSKDNSVGKTVTEKRRNVDDNRNNGCSNGLHAGTLSYVDSFGRFHNGPDSDKKIIVKINPANVVSVPLDCSCQKLRTCEYYVLKDYAGELKCELAQNNGNAYENKRYYDSYGRLIQQ